MIGSDDQLYQCLDGFLSYSSVQAEAEAATPFANVCRVELPSDALRTTAFPTQP